MNWFLFLLRFLKWWFSYWWFSSNWSLLGWFNLFLALLFTWWLFGFFTYRFSLGYFFSNFRFLLLFGLFAWWLDFLLWNNGFLSWGFSLLNWGFSLNNWLFSDLFFTGLLWRFGWFNFFWCSIFSLNCFNRLFLDFLGLFVHRCLRALSGRLGSFRFGNRGLVFLARLLNLRFLFGLFLGNDLFFLRNDQRQLAWWIFFRVLWLKYRILEWLVSLLVWLLTWLLNYYNNVIKS